MSNLEQYADYCAAERLRQQMQDDYLGFAEIDDEEIEQILKAITN